MLGWIISLFAGLSGWTDLLNRTRDGFVGLWNHFTGIFGGWAASFIGLWNAAWYFTDRAWNLWFACLDFAEWTAFHAFPQWAGNILAQVTAWALKQLSALRNIVAGWVNDLRAWAIAELNTIRNTVTGWVNTIRSDVANLWNRFRNTEARVVQLLTNPRALADWLAGEISKAVARWVIGNAQSLARLLLQRAVGMTTQAAQVMERILVDLFL